MSKAEKIALAFILIIAALLRLWRFPSYFPHFWDEAKYLCEVEGTIPYFSVNVGAFTFLKLGYSIFGLPSYPQIVTALFGVLTVLGCYFLGKRILQGERQGILLGLLMAGQVALMPYFVRYSRHALATGFALCFFVFALYFYLSKLQHPPVKKPKDQKSYLRCGVIAAGLLAMVPACSFKFLLPTLTLFVVLEVFIWQARKTRRREYMATQSLVLSVIVGLALFFLIPLILAGLSGYAGWLDRAVFLSEAHAARETMRLAFHFLYPIQLYYLSGPLFTICSLAGALLLLRRPKSSRVVMAGSRTNYLLVISFAVYLLFFGILSHLQSARVYVLTLPFLVYASSFMLLRVRYSLARFGSIACGAIYLLLLVSMGYITIDYMSKSSSLKPVSDIITQQIKPDQVILSSSGAQIFYCIQNSKYYRGIPCRLQPIWTRLFLENDRWAMDANGPPVMVIQDGVNLAVIVHEYDSRDLLEDIGIDSLRSILRPSPSIVRVTDRIFAATEDFYNTPYYYLEGLYSWRSYEYVKALMPQSRDSVYVYITDPSRLKTSGEKP